MKKQKGQVIVEFAIVLPLFLFLIFGLIYSGMLFHDYSTLSNIARSAAREKAISTEATDAAIMEHYYDTANKQFKGGLLTQLYKPVSEDNPIVFSKGNKTEMDNEGHETTVEDADDIIVTIGMQLNTRLPFIDIVLPPNFNIVYHMRKDS